VLVASTNIRVPAMLNKVAFFGKIEAEGIVEPLSFG
jgi:hypothetical protein